MINENGFEFIIEDQCIRIEQDELSYQGLLIDSEDIQRIKNAVKSGTDGDFSLKQGGAYYVSEDNSFELSDSTDDYYVSIDATELITDIEKTMTLNHLS